MKCIWSECENEGLYDIYSGSEKCGCVCKEHHEVLEKAITREECIKSYSFLDQSWRRRAYETNKDNIRE